MECQEVMLLCNFTGSYISYSTLFVVHKSFYFLLTLSSFLTYLLVLFVPTGT